MLNVHQVLGLHNENSVHRHRFSVNQTAPTIQGLTVATRIFMLVSGWQTHNTTYLFLSRSAYPRIATEPFLQGQHWHGPDVLSILKTEEQGRDRETRQEETEIERRDFGFRSVAIFTQNEHVHRRHAAREIIDRLGNPDFHNDAFSQRRDAKKHSTHERKKPPASEHIFLTFWRGGQKEKEKIGTTMQQAT